MPAEHGRRQSPCHHGVFQERQSWQRGEVFGNHGDKQHQKAARTAFRQRPASGVIDVDLPALQGCNNRFGKLSVRGYKRRGLFRRFQNLAHGKRNDIRLDRAVWRGNHTQARQRIPPQFRMCAAKLAPVGGQGSRLEYLTHQRLTQQGRLRHVSTMGPWLYITRGQRQTVQQHRQLMLRVAGILTDILPVIRRRGIEARQHDMPVWQGRNTADQFTRGSKGTGGTGDDNQILRRCITPNRAAQAQQPVAPVGGINFAAILENLRPPVDQNGQQCQNILPMGRKPVGKKIAQLCWRGISVAKRIQQPAEGFCQHHRLRRCRRHAAKRKAAQQTRQRQLPPQWIDRRRAQAVNFRDDQ